MDITAIIRQALDHDAIETDALVTKRHADDLAAELAKALDALGYTIKAKPKPRTAAAAEPVEELILTGDASLDAFIEKHHRPDWRKRLAKALQKTRPGMANMPPEPPGHPRKPMTQKERAALWEVHRVQHISS